MSSTSRRWPPSLLVAHPAMSCLVAHLEALAALVVQVGGGGGVATGILRAQKVHLEQQLETMRLSIADASSLVSALDKISWPKDHRDQIVRLIAERTTTDGVTHSGGRCKQQDFTNLGAYFTAQQWAVLSSEREQPGRKLEEIVHQSLLLQCRSPTEGTLQTMTSLFLASSEGMSKATTLLPRFKHESLRHVKKVFKSMSARAHHIEWIQQLPGEPSKLLADHPAVYAAAFTDAGPSVCPLDTVRLSNLTQSIPMRTTSKLMAASPVATGHDAVGSAGGQQKHLMGALLSAFQQLVGGGPQLDIHFLGSRAQPALPPSLQLTPPKAVPSPMPLPLEAPAAVAEAGGEEAEEEKGQQQKQGQMNCNIEILPSGASQGKRRRSASQGMSVADSTALILQQMEARAATPQRKGGKSDKGSGKKVKGAGKAKGSGKNAKSKQSSNPVEKTEVVKAVISVEWSREQVMTRGALCNSPPPDRRSRHRSRGHRRRRIILAA